MTTPCHVCLNEVEVDGEHAGVWAGKVVCVDCLDVEVTYIAECVDCDWDYTCTDRVSNWYHVQVRVQQRGNTHEGLMSFSDENHETVWRVLDGTEVSP